MILNSVLVVLALLCVGVALGVIMNSPKRPANIIFASFSLTTAGWLLSNSFSMSIASPELGLFVTRLITPFSALSVLLFVLFVLSFPDPLQSFRRRNILALCIPVALIIGLSPTSLNVALVSKSSPPEYTLGALYLPYLGVLTSYLLGGFVLFLRRFKAAKGLARLQLNYVMVGLFLFLVPALISGAILPALGYEQLWNYSPLFSVFLIGLTSYAIVRHRLFDVRAVVARSVTYVLILTTLTVSYGLVLTIFSISVFGSAADSSTVVISTIAAVLVALSFQPLRRYFDRFSNRVFYRDAYRSQTVVDAISHSLVSTLDISLILKNSAQLLADAIKPAYIHFTVFDDGTARRAYSINYTKPVTISNSVINYAHRAATQSLDPYSVPEQVSKWLRKYDCEYAVALMTQGRCNGLIMLGPKQSGSTYSKQDKELLSISSNNIALAIENAKNYNQVSHFAETLKGEVARATQRLRRTNTALERTSRAKDEFMSMASHQLRPQLSAAMGFVQLLRRDIQTPKSHLTQERQELLGLAEESVARMSLLVGDMLNSSRYESGSLQLELSTFDLCQMVKDELRINARRLKNHQLTLDFSSSRPEIIIRADSTKLREVTMNMIDNAIQYSPTGSTISVDVTEDEQSVKMRVHDEGMGVPVDEQHRLFEKFFRASNAISTRPSGTGIGLYVAKRVISEHGGNVLFESTPGDGSTFGFALPKQQA